MRERFALRGRLGFAVNLWHKIKIAFVIAQGMKDPETLYGNSSVLLKSADAAKVTVNRKKGAYPAKCGTD